MKTKTLRINVKDKIATYLQRDGVIVCGNKGYMIAFTFDEEWDEFAWKTARFIWNGTYYDVNFAGNECSVPVIDNTTKVTVGVYAGNLKTTTPAEIPCLISILCADVEVADVNIQECRDIAQQAALEAQQAASEAKQAATAVVHPTIDVEEIEGGHRLTINDADGEKTFDVMDGEGSGEQGLDGKDGATFTPSVSSEGVISWTNDKGLANPDPVNIKGEQGNPGVGISKAEINENGELVITYTGGNSEVAGNVVGEGGGLTPEQLERFNTLVDWYNESTYTTMTASITPKTSTFELGSTNSLTFKWTFKVGEETAKLSKLKFRNSERDATSTSATVSGITSAGEYVVEGTRADGKNETATAKANVYFYNKYYFGCDVDPQISPTSSTKDKEYSDFIKGSNGWNGLKLKSDWANSRKTFTYTPNCPDGSYIWYAYPKRLGTSTFKMNGLPADFNVQIINFTNGSSYSEDYYLYRSIEPSLGSIEIQVL